MPDNKTIRHPQDGDRIDINDPLEVANWTRALGVSEEQLKKAVQKVGTYADDVRKELGK